MCGHDETWHLALVRPNCLNVALRNLERQRFKVFLPRDMKTHRRGGKFVDVPCPLFPGYIFVSFSSDSLAWRKINSTYGIARLVSFGNRPATVPLEFMNGLIARCDEGGFIRPLSALSPGDDVILKSGPFAQFIAKVETLSSDKRVWVLLDLMGIKTRVLARSEQLQRIS